MTVDGTAIEAPELSGQADVLTPEAVGFVTALVREFGPRRAGLLAARAVRMVQLSAAGGRDFLA